MNENLSDKDDQLPEYDLDYRLAMPNPYLKRADTAPMVRHLSGDLADVFPTDESVNAALRFVIRLSRENPLAGHGLADASL